MAGILQAGAQAAMDAGWYGYIAIPPLNGLARAENRERINVFSATGETVLKVNCYISGLLRTRIASPTCTLGHQLPTSGSMTLFICCSYIVTQSILA